MKGFKKKRLDNDFKLCNVSVYGASDVKGVIAFIESHLNSRNLIDAKGKLKRAFSFKVIGKA